MQSIRVHQFGGPDVLKLEQLPDPQPGPEQVLVKIHSIGINPVDTYIRAGKYGLKHFPYTPGTDASGVIEAVGASVQHFKIGQRVYLYGAVDGTYTEKALCESHQVHPLSDKLSFDQGAAIGVPFGTAYRALFIRGNAKPNEHVLIHGASGGVGTAAVQLAANFGCRTLGTAGTPDGLKLVTKLGALQAFDHQSSDYTQKIMDFTHGKGVDLIIEMLSDKNLDKDLGLLARRGRVVIIGNRGAIQIDPRQTMAKDSDIRGMSLTNADTAELTLIHAALGAGLANGTLMPVIGKGFAFAQVGKAHEAVMESGALGKIVVRV